MRIGILGRTRWLLSAAEAAQAAGHRLAFVQSCPPVAHYDASLDDFAALAARAGVPFIGEGSVARALDAWRGTGTDVCLSLNWPTLIGADALGAFRHGILNAHAGDLPRYRGNACPNWAILNFEDRIGLTIHRMTGELDAGPVIHKEHLPIGEQTYIGEVYAWLEARVPAAFVAALGRLDSGAAWPDTERVRPLRAFPRRPEDARLDWKAPTRAVLALIRASSRPFPGAFTTLEGRDEVRVFRARAFDPGYDALAVPGQVCLSAGGNPVIATGDGMVEILDCEVAEARDAAAKRRILGSLRNRLA